MREDATSGAMRTLTPVLSGGSVLVFAVSGLGKSTFASQHPSRVLDADTLLYAAVAGGFPELKPRARLPAWRQLCRRRPWNEGGAALDQWASIRRGFVQPLVAALKSEQYALVLTSLLDPPWHVSAYYGIVQGHYLEHLRLGDRLADNRQSEAMNDRLQGYSPLVRLPAGSFLGQQPEILAWVGRQGDG